MVLSKRPSLLSTTFLLLGLGLALPAAARITCCEVDGKRSCGDPPPPQCVEIEAPLTEEQKAAREAEKARKAEEEKQAAEQARRDRALTGSYSSEKEIDHALERSIANIEKNASQAKARLETAQKKQSELAKEKEFYSKKPMPAQLKRQVEENEKEIAAQEAILKQKDADIEAVKTRFGEDKKRYQQLMGKSAPAAK
jgi:hypothetical protein